MAVAKKIRKKVDGDAVRSKSVAYLTAHEEHSIDAAAGLVGLNRSSFLRTSALERAKEILVERKRDQMEFAK